MKTLTYENEIYMRVTPYSAIRPHGKDRLKILNIDENGTIEYKSRTCKPSIKEAVEQAWKPNID